MPTLDETAERLKEHSVRIATISTQEALNNQQLTIVKDLLEQYHRRLHEAENTILVMRVTQEIHDAQIKVYKKKLEGNGDNDSIPMDILRLEKDIEGILKLDLNKVRAMLEWKDSATNFMRAMGTAVALLILNRIWEMVVR